MENEVAIYGAGKIGVLLGDILKKKGIKYFFIDDSKSGVIDGVDIKNRKSVNLDIPIFCSITSEVKYKIPRFLKNIDESFNIYQLFPKRKNIYTLEETIHIFPELLEKVFTEIPFLWWKYGKLKINKEITRKANFLKSFFGEYKSYQLFEQTIKFRETFDLKFYPMLDKDIQYFPKILSEKLKNLSFIDIGAYKGDTFLWSIYLLKNKLKFYIGLEPDINNFTFLKENLLKAKKYKGIYLALPFGISDKMDFLSVEEGNSSSKLIESEDNKVCVMNINSLVVDGNLNHYLKIDVEGLESKVLNGAKDFIQEKKPIIAIALYHKLYDIIDIPYIIAKEFPFYKFYLRQHRNFGLELILYCIREELV